MSDAILELLGISKFFAMTAALSDVSIALRPGEIHGIVGENGAGKSTLIKIMTGVHQPTSGQIRIDDVPVQLKGTRDAQERGIAAIYQEPMVFPDLDVAENIFISHNKLGEVVRWREMYAEADRLIARLGVSLEVDRAASGLTLAGQQTVEIARALALDVKVLIMDEPTASLSAHEVDQLLRIARALKAEGVAVVYISHRLEEVVEIADRVTVLRDGQHVSTRDIGDVTTERMIAEMVGRDAGEFFAREKSHATDKVALSIEGLTVDGAFADVTFDVHAGEVVCLAGLVGARRTDVALSIFGVVPAESGTIAINGKAVAITNPKQAMELGIAYVSEDRRKLGLAMPMSIVANTTLATLEQFLSRSGLVNRRRERDVAESFRRRLNIRTPNVNTSVGTLSGGNQQKVMLSKWLNAEPSIMIFDEPTRGIDVGAKAEVHEIIHELAASGVAVLVISSDLPEVLSLADRIIVMREGRQMGIYDGAEATQENVMQLATGQELTAEPA